ncbi:MAG: hypothetical protein IKJ45_03800 [Kiritimatiellae bacterium]|nr:hypothetical protein [Kiritimatiellia bacterium]
MKYNTGLFLFGSYMQSVNPHDIDLLWLYDKTVMSPESMLATVNEIESFMAARLPVPIHHTILSTTENTETGFLESVDAVFVGGLSEETNILLGRVIRMKG